MSIDITQLAKQYQPHLRAMEAAGSVVRSFLEEQERWRKQLIQPSYAMQSILDQVNEQQDFLRQYRELISSPAQLAINELVEHNRKFDRLAETLGPSRAFLDVIEHNRTLLDQVARFSDPFRDVLERLKLDQVAPWASQLESASEHVRKLLESLPDEDYVDDETLDWHALGGHLESVQGAIEQLPLTGATRQQIHAMGLSRVEWVTLFLTLVNTVIAILGILETRAQGRVARDQAVEEQVYRERADKEEQEYRERLLAAIGALAKHSPSPQEQYFVGARAVRVKSAISKGMYLDTAHPNQVVVATGDSGRWVKIKYRNHLEERDVEGWVLKHYLIRQQAVAGGEEE